MKTPSTARRVSTLRKVGWVSVASMLALALLAPAVNAAPAVSFSGAIWTSLADGGTVNANIYDNRDDVYLNGGPQNCGNSKGLPDGDYYFQVTDPSGANLLSEDAIKFRQVAVVNGVIAGVSGDGDHLVGSLGCADGLPVQLMPYDSTNNNGGEYSVDMAAKSDVMQNCPNFAEGSTSLNFLACAKTKNDNFKVRLTGDAAISIAKVADQAIVPADGANVTYTYTVTNPGAFELSDVTVMDDKCTPGTPVTYVSGDTHNAGYLDLDESWIFTCTSFISQQTTNTATASGWWDESPYTAQDQATVNVADPTAPPTASPTIAPTASPTIAPTASPTPFQSVLAEIDIPTTTLPPTDEISGAAKPSMESWRMLLIAAAVLLASIMVLTPATARSRRRR